MACATCNFKRSKQECEVTFREEHLRRTKANVQPSKAIIYDNIRTPAAKVERYYPDEGEPKFIPPRNIAR